MTKVCAHYTHKMRTECTKYARYRHTLETGIIGNMEKHLGKRLAVWLPDELFERMECQRKWRSKTEYIRMLIERDNSESAKSAKAPAVLKIDKRAQFIDHVRQFNEWFKDGDIVPRGLTLEEYANSIYDSGQCLGVYAAWEGQGFIPD